MSHASFKSPGSPVIPTLRYRDALAGIDWLVRALGFERKAVYMGENDRVEHAELTFGTTGMIMLGTAGAGEAARWMVQPDETGGRETVLIYLIATDTPAVYAMAVAAGAEILAELREMSYGGHAFSCRDPEGHVWSIGAYDPWASVA